MHNRMQKLKELVNLSNLCNFQLFASNNSGKSSHRKRRSCWREKTLMGPYIVYKVLSFYNFSKTIRYVGFKFLQITEIVMLFWHCVFDSLIREGKANANEEKKTKICLYIPDSSGGYVAGRLAEIWEPGLTTSLLFQDAELSTKDSLVCHPGDSLRRRSTTALESSSGACHWNSWQTT